MVSLKGNLDGSEVVYADWRPQAGHTEIEPANDLSIHAKLQKPDGSATDERADNIRFELVEVSQIPGVAMKYPKPSGAQAKPDLMFDPDVNAALNMTVVNGAAEKSAATTTQQNIAEAEAVLTSHDWVYDVLGRTVATVVKEMRDRGR